MSIGKRFDMEPAKNLTFAEWLETMQTLESKWKELCEAEKEKEEYKKTLIDQNYSSTIKDLDIEKLNNEYKILKEKNHKLEWEVARLTATLNGFKDTLERLKVLGNADINIPEIEHTGYKHRHHIPSQPSSCNVKNEEIQNELRIIKEEYNQLKEELFEKNRRIKFIEDYLIYTQEEVTNKSIRVTQLEETLEYLKCKKGWTLDQECHNLIAKIL